MVTFVNNSSGLYFGSSQQNSSSLEDLTSSKKLTSKKEKKIEDNITGLQQHNWGSKFEVFNKNINSKNNSLLVKDAVNNSTYYSVDRNEINLNTLDRFTKKLFNIFNQNDSEMKALKKTFKKEVKNKQNPLLFRGVLTYLLRGLHELSWKKSTIKASMKAIETASKQNSSSKSFQYQAAYNFLNDCKKGDPTLNGKVLWQHFEEDKTAQEQDENAFMKVQRKYGFGTNLTVIDTCKLYTSEEKETLKALAVEKGALTPKQVLERENGKKSKK
jgi:hypothetical protein